MLIHLKFEENFYLLSSSKIVEISPFVDSKNQGEYGLWLQDSGGLGLPFYYA